MAVSDSVLQVPINVGNADRKVSAVLGTALVLHALVRPTAFHTALGIAGAALVARGVGGYCALYQALGIDTNAARSGRHGNGHGYARDAHIHAASEDSFPASDPPSWTPTSPGHPSDRG
jgi:hypothetical protein